MTRPSTRARPRGAYHHGDLRATLLREAEAILERDGIPALTLRAAARAAGVSHAAPANHFDDLTGLLSELAADGFRRFSAALSAAMEAAGSDPRPRMTAMGRAYIHFARAHPGLFALMFRSERLDFARSSLRAAVDEARASLRVATAARAPAGDWTPLQQAAQATALWSLVHGFAVLMIEGRLKGTLAALPPPAGLDELIDAVLGTTRVAD